MREKAERNAALESIRAELIGQFAEEYLESERDLSPIVREVERRERREAILSTGKRTDGWGLDDVRLPAPAEQEFHDALQLPTVFDR